MDHFSLTI